MESVKPNSILKSTIELHFSLTFGNGSCQNRFNRSNLLGLVRNSFPLGLMKDALFRHQPFVHLCSNTRCVHILIQQHQTSFHLFSDSRDSVLSWLAHIDCQNFEFEFPAPGSGRMQHSADSHTHFLR